ncbi:MAG TPA: HD domain-containing protein, partial [bacterium]|nr:HD domain-containing protein [bacterium]
DDLRAWPPERLRTQATRRLREALAHVEGAPRTSAAAPEVQRAQPERAQQRGGGPDGSRQEGPILTRLLIAALQQVRHYGPQHPMAAESVQRLDAAMGEELRRRPVIQWEAAGDWLIAQGAALPDGDRYAQELRRHLTARGIARLTISPSMNSERLRTFIRILSREPEELIAAGGIAEAVRSAGVQGVEVDAPTTDAPLPPETDEYRDACATASEIFAAVERGETSIDAGRVHIAVEPLAVRDDPLPLWRQVVIRAHDELDAAHAVNVAFLTTHIAQLLGLGRAEQMDLGVAAFLHDIGMARLTWEERLAERTRSAGTRPQRHAAEGGLLLRHMGGPSSLPMLVAMEHHHVFAGHHRDLTPHSRLVALVDYVDAMTCGRVVGVRPMTIGGLLTALLAGELPVFDPVHVHALVALTGRVSSAGVDVATPA